MIAEFSIREPLNWFQCTTRIAGHLLKPLDAVLGDFGGNAKLILERVALQQTLYLSPILGVGIPIMVGYNISRSRPLQCRDFAKGFALSRALTAAIWTLGFCFQSARINLLCSHLYQVPVRFSQQIHT